MLLLSVGQAWGDWRQMVVVVGGVLLVLEEPAASCDRQGRDKDAVASSRDGKTEIQAGQEWKQRTAYWLGNLGSTQVLTSDHSF